MDRISRFFSSPAGSFLLVWPIALLLGCGASQGPPVAALAAPDADAGATASADAGIDPCGEHTGLVIEDPPTFVSEWRGSQISGGTADIVLRWCGAGTVRTIELDLTDSSGLTFQRHELFTDAPLVRGAVVTREIMGPSRPMIIEFTARATDDRGVEHVTRVQLESVDDPAFAAQRDECVLAGGAWAQRGMGHSWLCDRPTRDHGQRCTSDLDCEGPCVPERRERAVGAASCPSGSEPYLWVGRCHQRSVRFGCQPRLRETLVECVATAPSARGPHGSLLRSRLPHVCID